MIGITLKYDLRGHLAPHESALRLRQVRLSDPPQTCAALPLTYVNDKCTALVEADPDFYDEQVIALLNSVNK